MPKRLFKSLEASIEEGIVSSFSGVVMEHSETEGKDAGGDYRVRILLAFKRSLDLILGVLFFLMSLPLFLIICLAIQFTDGVVFYKQDRVGHRGRIFRIWKFNTMHADDSEEDHREYVRELLEKADQEEARVALVSKYIDYIESRTTKVGRFLRSTSLDELPQLINIVKGDMSLVGPRPHPVYEVEEYKDWYRRRLAVKPGLTGWSKINLRCSPSNYEESILYDLWYVDHWSLRLDLKIIFMTVPFVLFSKDAR